MTDFERIPAFPGGIPVDGVYNAGPMLADDKDGPTDEDAKMRFYTGASEDDIARYAGILREKDG